MSHIIKWKENNVTASFEDDLTFSDLYTINTRIYGDKRLDNMEYQISDFRKVNDVKMTVNEIEIIGSLDKASGIWNNEIKVACVGSEKQMVDKKIFDLYLIYKKELSETNWSIEYFEDFEEAENWGRGL